MTTTQRFPSARSRGGLTAARNSRDAGQRRVRKITWRIGLLSAAAAAVMGAKFAHLTTTLDHLGSSLGSAWSSGENSSGSSSSSSTGASSSSGVSSSSGGGVTTSGGS